MQSNNIKYIHSQKFKTNQIKLYYILDDFSDFFDLVLLPSYLMNGNESYPSKKIIYNYLEDLYDSSLNCSFRQLGNKAIFTLKITYLKDKYANEEISKEIIGFINDFLYKPLLNDDNFFRADVLEREKGLMINFLEQEVDRKSSYANKLMFLNSSVPNEYKYNYLVDIEKISQITNQSLQNAYKKFFENAKLKVYFCGEINETYLDDFKREDFPLMITNDLNFTASEQLVIKKIPAHQTILNMMYLTNINYTSHDSKALSLLSNILGQSQKSLLFQRLREDESLCYYVNTSYDNTSGAFIVSLGLKQENIDIAIKLIDETIEKVVKMDYDDILLDYAKLAIKESLIESLDDLDYQMQRYFYDDIFQRSHDVFENIEKYFQITKKDLARVAKYLKKDVTHILMED